MLDRAHRWLTVLVTYLCMAAMLLALALLKPEMLGTSIAVFCCGSALVGAQAIIYVCAPVCYTTAYRGTGVGSAVAIGRVGSVGGPLLAGLMLSSGYSVPGLLLRLLPLVLVGGLAALIVTRRTAGLQIR